MKKFTLIILLITTSICIYGQSRQDQAQILQQCIDLPELQQYFPIGNDATPKQICILQHGVSFPSAIEAAKFGKSVQLMDKKQLSESGTNSYFLFWEFKTDQNAAHVDFVYNYIGSDSQPKMQRVILELQKRGEVWIVVKTNIEEK